MHVFLVTISVLEDSIPIRLLVLISIVFCESIFFSTVHARVQFTWAASILACKATIGGMHVRNISILKHLCNKLLYLCHNLYCVLQVRRGKKQFLSYCNIEYGSSQIPLDGFEFVKIVSFYYPITIRRRKESNESETPSFTFVQHPTQLCLYTRFVFILFRSERKVMLHISYEM